MDFDKYREELQKKLEQNRQAIRSGLFGSNTMSLNQQNTSEEPNKVFHLKLYDNLEPECQAKLGTFERMVNGEQRFLVKGDYSYDTSDYAPLINLLGCVIEIESMLSIWQLLRSLHGIIMPDYFDKDQLSAKKKNQPNKPDYSDARVTFGELLYFVDNEKNDVSQLIPDFKVIVSLLRNLKEFRNDASHGVLIEKSRFDVFFDIYKSFHENKLPILLKIKADMKSSAKSMEYGAISPTPFDDEYKNELFEDDKTETSKDSMSAEEYISRLNTMFEEFVSSAATMADDFKPVVLTEKIGIILTDIRCLASKYNCQCEDVYRVLKSFIDQSEKYNQYWKLLDMSEITDTTITWSTYNSAITRFILANNLSKGLNLHLLIVGGQDVVPSQVISLPRIGTIMEKDIPTDLCYAFSDNYLDNFINGKQNGINLSDVRNTVSRLPLQDGSLSHYNIEKDLGKYFSNSLSQMRGITGKNIVMVTNKEWLTNSENITRNIPLTVHADDPDFTHKNMYVCPDLDVNDASLMKYFRQSYSDADLLLFNLHASDAKGHAGFVGCGSAPNDSHIAFTPQQMAESKARVVMTIACYGARYDNYSRDDSMLMTALYKSNALVYVGSQVSVPMYRDSDDISRRALIFGQYNGSEVLLRMWTLYFYYGESVGSAFLRAICDYFNRFRNIESDQFALKTILMFSLYGNPMLTLQRSEKILLTATENNYYKGESESICVPFLKTESKNVYSKEEGHHKSLLERLRGMVDKNFESIHKMVEENLYKELGLPPRQLYVVNSFSRSNSLGEIRSGYLYKYNNPDAMYSKETVVEVDDNRQNLRVNTTK